MEHRADAVGKNALYTMLRLMLTTRAASVLPLRFFLLGHSFGSKVICAALNDLQVDIAGGTIARPQNVAFRVTLLEAATDNDNLNPGDIYGELAAVENLRLLITTSALDKALHDWYPAAARAANLFHGGSPTPALGAAGPTAATQAAFGGAQALSVNPGYTMGAAPATGRLVVADLTPVHQARVNAGLYDGGFSGSHSDINIAEVYELVMGFMFS
jgi:hypothetical protein